MQDSFSEFYTDKKILFASGIIAAVLAVVTGIMGYVHDGVITTLVSFVFFAVCMIVLCASYHLHEKNVMKGMIGVVLTWAIMSELPFVAKLFTMQKIVSISYLGGIYTVAEVLFTALFFVAFFTHFLINSDHHSSPRLVLFNQIIIIVQMFVAVLQLSLAAAIFKTGEGGMNAGVMVCNYITYVFLLINVISIESQLDARRQQREANGWQAKKPEKKA